MDGEDKVQEAIADFCALEAEGTLTAEVSADLINKINRVRGSDTCRGGRVGNPRQRTST